MNAPFGRPGGKKQLVRRLLPLVPAHRIYVEPFCGAARLLFAKPPSRWEILNDSDLELVSFFRVAKHRPAELAELLERECVHRLRFRELKEVPAGDDEMQRAFRFLYLTVFSFGSKGQHYAMARPASCDTTSSPTRRALSSLREMLAAVSRRLDRVLIEHLDFAAVVRRYDSPQTFFFCDPPYFQFRSVGAYTAMPLERHRELAALLGKIEGKFLLTYDDAPQARAIWKPGRRLFLRRIRGRYTLSKGASRRSRELLISNFPLPHP